MWRSFINNSKHGKSRRPRLTNYSEASMSSHPDPNAPFAPSLEPLGLTPKELEWLRKDPPTLDKLAEIATLIRSLTFGEMITLAQGIGIEPAKLHEWSTSSGTP